jgi:Helix-turn-helix
MGPPVSLSHVPRKAIYGSPSGLWALLIRPPSCPPPPYIDLVGVGAPGQVTYLGTPSSLLRGVYERLRDEAVSAAMVAYDVRDRAKAQLTAEQRAAGHVLPPAPARVNAQRDLAQLLGVSQQSVSRYLAGLSAPALTAPGWRALVLEAWRLEIPTSSRAAAVS